MPVPNKDAAGVDPSASVYDESNGVNCNTGPYELKGLVDGAGFICVLAEGTGSYRHNPGHWSLSPVITEIEAITKCKQFSVINIFLRQKTVGEFPTALQFSFFIKAGKAYLQMF